MSKSVTDAHSSVKYVLTPGGYVADTLVHHVADGDIVGVWGGRLQERRPSGLMVADFGPMPAAADTGSPLDIVHRSSIIPSGNPKSMAGGWIAYAYWNRPSGHAITADTAKWVVPAAPTSSDGQTIFLFNGIESSSTILQPVLQWGSSAAGGGNYWTGTCWYVVGNTTWYYGTLLSVSAGDHLTGVVDSASTSGYSCHLYTPSDSTSYGAGGTVPELTQAVITLEAYNISYCSDYPDATLTAFTGLSLAAHSGISGFSWTRVNSVTGCGQEDSVVSNSNPGGEDDIYFRPPPPPLLTTGISGSSVISTKGTYTWTAEPSGGTGTYSYAWTYREDGGSDESEGTSVSQSKTVYEGDPNFWWIVSVTSGDQVASDSIYVTNCIGEGEDCGMEYPLGGGPVSSSGRLSLLTPTGSARRAAPVTTRRPLSP